MTPAVMPAKAVIHTDSAWTPASAGVTPENVIPAEAGTSWRPTVPTRPEAPAFAGVTE
ncbi:MAG: hypothetical protein QOG72_783 [Sphingomonadales bacterium]|jgi:hypothetical protein|nr:hypothetical protein [Sphingomonadales bacterium]